MPTALFQIILNVVLNLFGILFAIAAIVLYSIDLAISDLDLCDTLDEDQYYYSEYKAWSKHYREKCLNMKQELLVSLVLEFFKHR